MEGAAEPEWERHSGIPMNLAPVGHLRSGEQSDQCRFPGAVGAENSDIVPRREGQRRIVQHHLAAAGRLIGFGDAVERNHTGSLSLRRNPRSRAMPPSNAKIARIAKYV